MTLREFLQQILPTEVDFVFLPDDLAKMDVMVKSESLPEDLSVTKIERDFQINQLLIHTEY